RGCEIVGWAKARSAVPTIDVVRRTVGTLRFAHPTGECETVGWVERSDTHHDLANGLVGIGSLNPPYTSVDRASHLAPAQERQPLEQMHVLLVLEQRAVQRRDQLARVALAQLLRPDVLVEQQLQPVEQLRRRRLL